MTDRVQAAHLSVAAELHRFVEAEALPGTGVDAHTFWVGVDAIVHDLAPGNRELLARRAELQSALDAYYLGNRGGQVDSVSYEAFLREMGCAGRASWPTPARVRCTSSSPRCTGPTRSPSPTSCSLGSWR
jgi:malate synthase